MDNRGSFNFVPGPVQDEIARGMDRPSPGNFLPVLKFAYLAGSMALRFLHILYEKRIEPENYMLDSLDRSILLALFASYPQTAAELYKNLQNKIRCTAGLITEELILLKKLKIVKIKHREHAPALYSKNKAIALIEKGPAREDILKSERQQWMKLYTQLKLMDRQ